MRLGIDLGTTWTAAAIQRDGQTEAVQLAQHTIAMPSVVAIADGAVLVGDAAERQLAKDPASGVREFKRRLGDSTPFVIAGTPYGAEALMAEMIKVVVAKAAEQAGQEPTTVTLSHPANWGEFKLDLLREAARIAGLDTVEFLSEPEAAARHYVQLDRLSMGDTVAVFDFGGGTFDAAVVQVTPDGASMLGKPEGLERLGGVDVDQAVLAHVDAALDGALQKLDTTVPETRQAVSRLRAECTAAKEALSFDTEATITVSLPGNQTEVRISRAELENVLSARLGDTLGALGRAVASASVSIDDLAGVLLVGGSSRMPIVAEMITSQTGRPALIDTDPKLAIAGGAAYAPSSAAGRPDPGEEATAASAASAPVESLENKSLESGSSQADASESGSSGPEPARKNATAAMPPRPPAPTRSSAVPPAVASDRGATTLRAALGIAGGVTAAASAAVGGYFAYKSWWDNDGDSGSSSSVADGSGIDEIAERRDRKEAIEDAQAEATAEPEPATAGLSSLADSFANLGGSLDEFDIEVPPAASAAASQAGSFQAAPAAPRPAAPRPTPQPAATQPPPAPAQPSRPAPSAQPPQDHQTQNQRPPAQQAPSTPAPPSSGLDNAGPFGSPELDSVREQLLERVKGLSFPDADPEDAARLQADLEGLVERYQPYAGQSLDDAIASLRYEFEDRMRDFAQDERIDALIEKQEAEQAAAEAVDTEVDAFRLQLEDRLANWQPPAGADPEEAAALKAELAAMVRDHQAVPGQTAAQAMADLRSAFNDRVGDFAQDLKIDALIDEAAGDESSEGEDEASADEQADGVSDETGEADEQADGVSDETGEADEQADGVSDETGEADEQADGVSDEADDVSDETADGDVSTEVADDSTNLETADDAAEDAEAATPEPDAGEPADQSGLVDVFDEGASDAGAWGENAPPVTEEPPTFEAAVEPIDQSGSQQGTVPLDDALADDLLGADAVETAAQTTDPLILTAEGVQAPGDNPDDGRLTKDLIPEIVGEVDDVSFDDDFTLESTVMPGGEFFDPGELDGDSFDFDDQQQEDDPIDAFESAFEAEPISG